MVSVSDDVRNRWPAASSSRAQRAVVVDLAVEDDPARAVLVGHRLRAAGEVDDRQPAMAEATRRDRRSRRRPDRDAAMPAFIARTAAGINGRQRAVEREHAADAAHAQPSLSPLPGCGRTAGGTTRSCATRLNSARARARFSRPLPVASHRLRQTLELFPAVVVAARGDRSTGVRPIMSGDVADVGADHRKSGRHGFEHRQWHLLGVRREREDVEGAIARCGVHRLAPAKHTRSCDAQFEGQLLELRTAGTVADDHETRAAARAA